jgi:hypothetical protein
MSRRKEPARIAERIAVPVADGSGSPQLWRGVARAIVAAAAVFAIAANNLVVDGTRYFWLDDDLMISMRYARNLAQGHGLVWNVGERVEGYTNFLWTLVMALVHVLPLSAAKTSLVVRAINAGIAGWVLLLAEKLLRRFVPEPGLALPALLLPLALCYDLLYWALHGFETTLLTAVFLLFLVRVLDERAAKPRVSTYLLLGLLPLIRSDAHALFAAGAVLALGVGSDRKAVLRGLGIAAVLPIAHLLFRYGYYGEWLPNTYALKVAGNGLGRRLAAGAGYLAYFGVFYWMYLLVGGLGAWRDRKHPRAWLLASLALPMAYTLYVGGDMYFGARFLAPVVPVLMVLALAATREMSAGHRPAEIALTACLAVSTLVATAFLSILGSNFSLLRLANGGPAESLVTALTIARNAGPDVRVAVHAAGMVPYFCPRNAIDLLGKTDPVVAHRPANGPEIGHNKYDPDYSLGKVRPDLVVMLWLPPGVGACTERDRATVSSASPSWVAAIYLSEPFQKHYCGAAAEVPGGSPIYVRRDSPEIARLPGWQPVRVGS